MSINLGLLKKRHRELAGVTRDTDVNIDTEELAIAYKLQSEYKSITEQNILIEKMKLVLKDMSHRNELKPFLTAICTMYQQTYALQTQVTNASGSTQVVLEPPPNYSGSFQGVESKKTHVS